MHSATEDAKLAEAALWSERERATATYELQARYEEEMKLSVDLGHYGPIPRERQPNLKALAKRRAANKVARRQRKKRG